MSNISFLKSKCKSVKYVLWKSSFLKQTADKFQKDNWGKIFQHGVKSNFVFSRQQYLYRIQPKKSFQRPVQQVN